MSERKPYQSDLSDEQWAASGVPAVTTGKDAAKRMPGRKRGLALDVLGLVIAVTVVAASVHDNAAGIALLDQVAVAAGGSVSKALVDQGFKNQVVTHGAALGIDVEIVRRNPEERGFVPRPKRWRVERTFGTLILHRRLVRDYEHGSNTSNRTASWPRTPSRNAHTRPTRSADSSDTLFLYGFSEPCSAGRRPRA